MEKLKPILAHRFWIISAPAILLPLIAWWMASGKLAAHIDERETALKAAFDSIPPADNPNDTWTAGLTVINKSIEKQNEESAHFLWQSQERLMFWPDDIEDTMAKIAYRETIPQNARNLFRTSYRSSWRDVFKTVKPYDVETGKGLVLFDEAAAPQIEEGLWETQPPTSDEMWDAQEDVWLLKAILESIQRVNALSLRVTESPIRSVEILEFRGGSKTPAGGGAAAGMGAGSMPAMPGGDMKAGGPMAGGPAGRGGSIGGGANNAGGGPAPADFPPEDEFGSQVGASEGDGAAKGSAPAAPGAMAGPMAGGAARGGMFGMDGGQKLIRYVDDEKDMPFKTRGFYLQVVMEIRHVPDLMVELTNNPYPVRIVRVQQADLMMDDVSTLGGSGTIGMRGGRGGMPMGGPMAGGVGKASGRTRSPAASRNPMGGRASPMGRGPMAGGKAPAGGTMGGLGSGMETAEYQAMAQSALSDPDLCTVAIAGVMTIYRPVAPKEATPGTSAPDSDPLAGGVDTPASDDETADETAEDMSDSEDGVPSEDDAESDPAAENDDPASEDTDGEPAESDPDATEPPPDESNPDDAKAEPADDDAPPADEPETEPSES